MPHTRVRIVDDTGNEVPAGPLGEITLRGLKGSAGYWRDEKATAAALKDGWLHTRDIGHVDENGFLFIGDRKKDMIVSGGENIATPEVERVLYEHPAVLEAAVVGLTYPRWNEAPAPSCLDSLEAELSAHGGKVLVLPGSVVDSAAVRTMVEPGGNGTAPGIGSSPNSRPGPTRKS
ncbi:AMP-binding enzyme [Streptomyces sp. NPDC002577]